MYEELLQLAERMRIETSEPDLVTHSQEQVKDKRNALPAIGLRWQMATFAPKDPVLVSRLRRPPSILDRLSQ